MGRRRGVQNSADRPIRKVTREHYLEDRHKSDLSRLTRSLESESSKPDEKRRSDRLMCSELVEIAFQDHTGHWVRETGVVEDVGSNGLGVNLSIPIDIGRPVTVSNSRFRHEATVKHCKFEEFGYVLGVEFSNGFEWDRRGWVPQHLLPLPKK